MRALRGILIPVLEDALNRSLALAAAMSSRGYGNVGAASARTRLVTGFLVVTGMLGVCVGLYGVMDGSTPRYMGIPMLLCGLAVATAGFVLGGRRMRRSRYRPDRWRGAEISIVACGLVAGGLMYLTTRVDPADLYPSLNPLTWPQVSLLPMVAILAGALPAWLAPPPAPSQETPAEPSPAQPKETVS